MAVAQAIGQPFMPWQEQVALVGGEKLPDGRPAYRAVVVTVERQAGKTMLVFCWQMQRAVGWDWNGPQRIAYSAQTGNDARKKLLEDQFPIIEPRRQILKVRRLLRGAGGEAVEFHNGSRVVLLASAADSGHGKTLDLAVKDELFADTDDRRDQAIIPAMATRPYGQVLTASTAGTEDSAPLRRAVEVGRQAVLEDRRDGIAYFEWSADEDADIDDPDTWWGCHPALGYTISEDVIRHARDTMSEGEFRRAFLNQWTVGNERVIPAVMWDAVNVPSTVASDWGDVAFGVAVNPERTAAAVAISDGVRCQVVTSRAGTAWVEDEVNRLRATYPRCGIGIDKSGPAASVVLEPDMGLTGQEMAQACASFFDAVVDRKVVVQRDAELDTALAGAAKRFVGDVWVWGRRSSSADVCPLEAVTVARWAALHGAGGPSMYEDRGLRMVG